MFLLFVVSFLPLSFSYSVFPLGYIHHFGPFIAQSTPISHVNLLFSFVLISLPIPNSETYYRQIKTQPPLPRCTFIFPIESQTKSKSDANGSWVSPNWLTSLLTRTLNPNVDESYIPSANAKLEDVSYLLGGTLFFPLFKWMKEYGHIYRLAAGPRNFMIVSDPAIAKHVLKGYGIKYGKGLVAEVSQFIFCSRFAFAEGSLWMARRRAVVPTLLKKYMSIMVDKVFCKCALRLVGKLEPYASNGTSINMEARFSKLTLDVIGLSLFNYNFDSLTSNGHVIEAVYTHYKKTFIWRLKNKD